MNEQQGTYTLSDQKRYEVTPWRCVLEKLMTVQLVKKLPAAKELGADTMLTRVCYWILS
jgi:hypothetical protein